ncbi:unnamed protein product [Phyllotreta striolata]|uniref:SWI/SNF-related matrix-associated actin-dependent regulator of chromatin subfamily A-like protein 1 n=1 Tax=Phyllotreta striolata TaxID=444603 RepID=A0A9N9XUV6_PHYSR|nr:unnamed protein product [Phyllotreta striolata]
MSVLQFYGASGNNSVKCSLISLERFQVELSGFDDGLINILKTIPSRYYNPQTRIWSFLIKDYELLLQKLEQLKPRIIVEQIPQFALKCIKATNQEVNIEFDKLDPVLAATLLPFQIDGLKFGIDKKGRCLIGDEMGLGKTFQALAIANYYKEDWPLLIITTSTMKTQWEETIVTYLPSIPILQVQYMITAKDYIGESKILIVSYDMMSRCCEKISQRNFGVMIVDESHTLKSFKSKCFLSAAKVASKAKRVILLSGTPALSRPSELYTQLSLLDKSFFGSFYNYSQRYCDAKITKFGRDCNGHSNLQELEVILAKKFMIRRTKEQVMKSIPNKKQEVITLDTKLNELTEEDRKCLNILFQEYQMQKGVNKHAALLTFFGETAKIKIPAICSYIKPLLSRKDKFLIFAHHKVMLNAVENLIKLANIKYIRIDGNTTTDQRKYFIKKFQTDDKYLCAVLSITATNAGISLTAAKLVLFAELHWNPSILSQAEARAHRIGQEETVLIQYLLCPGTADDAIWPMLQEKQRTLSAVGLCRDSFETVAIKKHKSSSDNDVLSQSAITNYLTPTKKPKLESDVFDDGLDEILCKSVIEYNDSKDAELLDDGLDDLFCEIEF